jgi:hypothetical protein
MHEVDDPGLADESAHDESSDERTPVVVEEPDDVAGETVTDVEPDIVDAPPTTAEPTLDAAGGSEEASQPALPLDLQIEPYHLDDAGAHTNGVQHGEVHDDRGASSVGVEEHSNGAANGTTSTQKLHARFLGARELVYNGDIVWPVAGVPDEAAMELLVFLGVEDPAGVRADLLSDSLWEEDDQDDEDRSYRLRKRRYRLRRALKRLIPGWERDPIARMDKQTPIYRLDPKVIESDVHCFLRLLDEGRSLPRDEAIRAYERAVALYRGDLLDRPDVPSYRWLDDGPRVLDLRVKYATMHQLARRRLGDLLAVGQSDDELARAQELYVSLVACDALDHRLWEALARLHGRRNDLLGLEATYRRLRSALVELGEGDDPDRVRIPPTLKRVFDEVRATLMAGRE